MVVVQVLLRHHCTPQRVKLLSGLVVHCGVEKAILHEGSSKRVQQQSRNHIHTSKAIVLGSNHNAAPKHHEKLTYVLEALGSRIPPHAVLLHVNNKPVKLKIIFAIKKDVHLRNDARTIIIITSKRYSVGARLSGRTQL